MKTKLLIYFGVVMVFTFLFAGSAFTEVLDPDVVAYWRLDEGEGTTIYDSSSAGVTGTLYLGTSGNTNISDAWISGKVGNALNFDGVDDTVNIPNENFAGLTDFTMSAWIKAKGVHKNYDGAIIASGNWNFGKWWSFSLMQNNDGIRVRIPNVSTMPYSFELDRWYQVTITRDGSTLYYYVDGLIIGSEPCDSFALVSDASNTMIGRETYLGGYFAFNGAIDEVAIYSRALTAEEIEQHYQDSSQNHNLVLVPLGYFQMGDTFDEGDSDEQPVHTVFVDSFYMDQYEITNPQFKEFVDNNSIWSKDGILSQYHDGNYLYDWNGNNYPVDKDDHPVAWTTWYSAAAYCNWRSHEDGLEPVYNETTWTADFAENGYRLPTEAEREKAARGGLIGKSYPWGDILTHDDANYAGVGGIDQWVYTGPVGSFAPNGYDLYDMAGNVWEWVHDWYGNDYYSNSPQNNPIGPTTGTVRVIRGGSWGNIPDRIRSAHRSSIYAPNQTNPSFGLRCVLPVAGHQNQPPDLPVSLSQHKLGGTEISIGDTADGAVVIFKGKVTDSDDNDVRLQVELRQTTEPFNDNDQSGIIESNLFSSGSTSTVQGSELIPGSYKWRARVIDEHGDYSIWENFGDNLDSDADFVIPKILPVPYYGQGDTSWCLPTSMAMIFKYFSKNIHSWDIAQSWNWDRDVSWWKFWQWDRDVSWWKPWKHFPATHNNVASFFNKHGLSAEYSTRFYFDDVREWLDQGKVVIISMHKIRHAIVAIGYSTANNINKIYVNDPSTVLSEKKLVKQSSTIATPIDWQDIVKHSGVLSYTVAVASTSAPTSTKGTIDLTDATIQFGRAKGSIVSYLYGLDKGLAWMEYGSKKVQKYYWSLGSEDQFVFNGFAIKKHLIGQSHTYILEISFIKQPIDSTFPVVNFATSTEVFIAAEDFIWNSNISFRLGELLQELGEYSIALRLWEGSNPQQDVLYDEIILPPIYYIGDAIW